MYITIQHFSVHTYVYSKQYPPIVIACLEVTCRTGPAALLLHEVCGLGAGACINCIPAFSTSTDGSIFNLCLLNAVYKTSTIKSLTCSTPGTTPSGCA